MKPVIWVEGIIGAGKSTFSREVSRRLSYLQIDEPVEDNPYLEDFYQDPKTHAFGMQIWLLHRRYAMQQIASFQAVAGDPAKKGVMLDRSISGDRVFARLHCEAGNISRLDWQTYEMCHQTMARMLLPPTLLVFLDVQAETAYKRVQSRDRAAERGGVSLEYLIKLRDGYGTLLREVERGLTPWAHAVRVTRLVWDPERFSESDWDAVARTVADACHRG